jgi:hypothetical protein
MKGEGFGCHSFGFVQSASSADNAWKIGKGHAEIAVGILMDEGNEMPHICSPVT